jgi:hypothetical protein
LTKVLELRGAVTVVLRLCASEGNCSERHAGGTLCSAVVKTAQWAKRSLCLK